MQGCSSAEHSPSGGTPAPSRPGPHPRVRRGPPLSLTELAAVGHPAVLPQLQLRHGRRTPEAEKRRGRRDRPGAGGAQAGPGPLGPARAGLGPNLSPPRRFGAVGAGETGAGATPGEGTRLRAAGVGQASDFSGPGAAAGAPWAVPGEKQTNKQFCVLSVSRFASSLGSEAVAGHRVKVARLPEALRAPCNLLVPLKFP